MKRNIFLIVLLAIILQVFASCVTSPRLADYVGMQKEVGLDEIRRMRNSNTIKIIANWLTMGWGTFWLASVIDSIRLVTIQSDFRRVEAIILATPPGVLIGHTPPPGTLDGAVHRVEAPVVAGLNPARLDEAIFTASGILAERMPRDMIIAVLSVSAANRNTSEYIIGELEYILLSTGRFRIVDRRRLDQVRTEQNFQISGVVSDDSAISIGNMLGAHIVITGEVTGTGANQRLLLKALEVQTGQIMSMARAEI